MDIKTRVVDLGGIYKRYHKKLEKLGIKLVEDFLFHIPSRYNDYSLISNIKTLQAEETITIKGTVKEIKNEYTKRGIKIQKAEVTDDSGVITAIWFNQPYLVNIIRPKFRISLSGKVSFFLGKLVLESPEYELIYEIDGETIHTGRLVPIYPETKGLSSKWLRRQVHKLLKEQKQNILEYIPDSIIKNNDLMYLFDAIEQIHFPKNFESAKKAKLRLSFDELFLLQLSSRLKKKEWEKKTTIRAFDILKFAKDIEEFWNKLPFNLTNAQKKAVKDIFSDLCSKRPMNRLLEGDVGSGKTVVAAAAMYLSHLNGFQTALMAPTEILAQQHHKTISNLLSPFGVKVDLVTGNKKLLTPNPSVDGQFSILIGTHALLSDNIRFDKLGLVVIDEQQRFGVEQRALIKSKGKSPHLLTMTATPIPRTVALTLYGDLNLSVLDEMPKGRQKIKTWVVPEEKRESAYGWIKEEIKKHKSQVFIVCPFIEESENMSTVKAAKKEYKKLAKDVFPNLRLGLLHGKLRSKDKDVILEEFRKGKYDILVSTPVVEVGIDIQNATVILIEAAERFGLAQLHQLRGRVGRGSKQSYCLIFTDSDNPATTARLKKMEIIHQGAILAEVDLKLRGPGEIYGLKQHGMPMLRVASFSDFSLIEKTGKEAEKILEELDKFPLLKSKMETNIFKKSTPD